MCARYKTLHIGTYRRFISTRYRPGLSGARLPSYPSSTLARFTRDPWKQHPRFVQWLDIKFALNVGRVAERFIPKLDWKCWGHCGRVAANDRRGRQIRLRRSEYAPKAESNRFPKASRPWVQRSASVCLRLASACSRLIRPWS